MRKVLGTIWRVISAPFRFIARIIRKIVHWLRSTFSRVKHFLTYEEEDTPLPDAFAKSIENPQGIFYHLFEFRKHVMRAVLALIIASAISFVFIQPIMGYLARPLEGGLSELQAIDVTENVSTVMKVTLLSGFTFALPYIVFELWLFAAPGLKVRSRLKALIAIPVAAILFVVGLSFAYFVMLPAALPFLLDFMGLSTVPRPSSYFNFVTRISFWIGLAFELPLLSYILADLGILKADQLLAQWRLAIVIIAVLAAAITPTIDPFNMALVMGPMILLYFLSIGLAYFAQRGRA